MPREYNEASAIPGQGCVPAFEELVTVQIQLHNTKPAKELESTEGIVCENI